MKSVLLPHVGIDLVDQSVEELARGQRRPRNPSDGFMTQTIVIAAAATEQHVEHKLGRVPIGWIIGKHYGLPPAIQVTQVDAKRIRFVSNAVAPEESRFAFWVW